MRALIDELPDSTFTTAPTRSGLSLKLEGHDPYVAWETGDDVGICLSLNEQYSARRRIDGTAQNGSPRVHAFSIIPPGSAASIDVAGNIKVLYSSFNVRDLFTTYVADRNLRPEAISLPPRSGLNDPLLVRGLYAAASATEPIPQQEALLCVAERLTAMSGAPPRHSLLPFKAGLSLARERRVRDFVEANLARKLALSELAAEAGLSLYHFARQFRVTFGMSPHAFIVQRRVERAIGMLHDPRHSVDAVAEALGFAQRSHMAKAVRQLTGLPPERLRSDVLCGLEQDPAPRIFRN